LSYIFLFSSFFFLQASIQKDFRREKVYYRSFQDFGRLCSDHGICQDDRAPRSFPYEPASSDAERLFSDLSVSVLASLSVLHNADQAGLKIPADLTVEKVAQILGILFSLFFLSLPTRFFEFLFAFVSRQKHSH
jgi:hypothetical protein